LGRGQSGCDGVGPEKNVLRGLVGARDLRRHLYLIEPLGGEPGESQKKKKKLFDSWGGERQGPAWWNTHILFLEPDGRQGGFDLLEGLFGELGRGIWVGWGVAFGPYIRATQKGYYKEEGLFFNHLAFNSSTETGII